MMPVIVRDGGSTLELDELPVDGDTGDPASTPQMAVGRPHLFLVFQSHLPFAPSVRYALDGLQSITIGRGLRRLAEWTEALRAVRLEVEDSWMSSLHARFSRAISRWVVEDLGSKNGTFLNGSRINRAFLTDGDTLEIGRSFFLYRDVKLAAAEARVQAAGEAQVQDAGQLHPAAPGLATLDPFLSRQFTALSDIARSSIPVLIRGESGTGKELIARALHLMSGRPGRFIAVNCPAIPSNLIESEFFGHRRGAFSGAVQDSPGLVRAADRGTLFLDEVGDLALSAQGSLLRVLQEKEVVPIGDSRPIKADFRVCAATHRPIEKLVARNKMRADFFARISGFTLQLPALRQRREDLGLILQAALKRCLNRAREPLSFHRRAARALFAYGWPLNIRELERALESAVALSKGGQLDFEHLPDVVTPSRNPVLRNGGGDTVMDQLMSAHDLRIRAELERRLVEHQGNLSAVARALGKHRVQICRWLKHYRIDVARFRSSSS